MSTGCTSAPMKRATYSTAVSYTHLVRSGDGGAALSLIGKLYDSSRDMERLCAELIAFYRDLMILKSVEDASSLIVLSVVEMAHMREEAAKYELPAILHAMDTLQAALERLKGGVSRRTEMESALLRLCSPDLDVSVQSLLRRIKTLENAVRAGLASNPSELPAAGSAASPRPEAVSADVDVYKRQGIWSAMETPTIPE